MRILLNIICLSLFFFSCANDADTSFVNRPDVQVFIQDMAKKHHFKQTELLTLFSQVKIRPKVMKKLKNPFENESWRTYQRLFVSEWRIRKGVEFWNKYQEALEQVEKKYGVPANIIVATLGAETKYGSYTGEFSVMDALTNIAFSDSSRAPFFRKELEEFLLLCREQHLNPLRVTGSYAGAIGQPQFMPSSYRHYAVSFSGHGPADLSHNEYDVIASVANYYKKNGWQSHQPIAVPVSPFMNKTPLFLGRNQLYDMLSKSKWIDYNIASKTQLENIQKTKLIKLQSPWNNEYWIGFRNFDVIKSYNQSNLYAMAVFQLSHYIAMLKKEEVHHA